jgi:hypothetical protein
MLLSPSISTSHVPSEISSVFLQPHTGSVITTIMGLIMCEGSIALSSMKKLALYKLPSTIFSSEL